MAAGHQSADLIRIAALRVPDDLRGDLGGHPKDSVARREDPRAIVVLRP